MKINFIINQSDNDSTTDANILSFMFKKIKNKIDIKLINVNNFKCEKASINIFFGCINNVLLDFAKSNILIPNQCSFMKEWTQYLDNFDLIIVKTKYMEEIFKTFINTSKLKYIGWRSTDLYTSVDKEYDEYLLYCYDQKYTDYKKIIDAWEPTYPTLNIVNGSLFNIKKNQENINYLNKLSQNEFEVMFNKCGVHICLNNIDSFSHNINQCMLSKSIPIIINGGPMKEIVNLEDCISLKSKKKKLNNLLGSKYDYDIDEFKTSITKIMNTSINSLESMSENNRKQSLKNHCINDQMFKELMSVHLKETRSEKVIISRDIESSELPKISCITLTHNRKHMFKLAVYNYQTCEYPKNKMEWIIYDTSNDDETVEEFLPNEEERLKMGIKYVHLNECITIGESRNKACELAKNDIIVFMDDDDYYFPQNINKRINALINNNKQIVGCSYLGSLAINKVISYVNAPNIYSSIGKSISPATLCFYKDILNDKCKFNNSNINECEDLFEQIHLKEFKELSWEEIIVSLSHKNNITNRNVPNSKSNGCLYGWTDKLLKFILEIDD
jgi:hypothetical protein